MTATLLKKLLIFEQRLEGDEVRFLSKDWDSSYKEGEFYDEELILVNSYKNTLKIDQTEPLKFNSRFKEEKKSWAVKWRDQQQLQEE